jgi:hypothetical protein
VLAMELAQKYSVEVPDTALTVTGFLEGLEHIIYADDWVSRFYFGS